jgi:hypothetical protein
MLTTAEIQEHLKRITYKDNWTFSYYEGVWEGPHLNIYCSEIADSFNPGKMTALDIHCFLSPNDIASTESLEIFLMYRLARIELHEMREFFKRDGKIISSPHMPNAEHDTQRFGVWKAQ